LYLAGHGLIPEDNNRALLLNALANVKFELRDFDGALHLYQSAKEICELAQGKDSQEVARILGNMAICQQFKGEWDKAHDLWVERVETMKLVQQHGMLAWLESLYIKFADEIRTMSGHTPLLAAPAMSKDATPVGDEEVTPDAVSA